MNGRYKPTKLTRVLAISVIPFTTAGIIWIVLSLFGSALNVANGNCEKDYPIGSILFLKAFCEIKKEKYDVYPEAFRDHED